MERKDKIVAVVPVYNEENKISDTIEGLKLINAIDNIIVVDDGSTDKTYNIIKQLGVNIIKLEKNSGKGYAIKSAIKNLEYEYLALVDGDLGKSSYEIEKLIDPVVNGEVDVTIAKFPPAKKKGGFGFVKKLAKNGIKYYTGTEINSGLSGQRVYKREVIEDINNIPDTFGIEVAMTVETLRKGYSIKEVDVNMTHDETERDIKGFYHRGKQFLNILWTLIKLGIRR
ncbi:MAG TPA: glycosyltransferase family 2 protein [Tissierellales bacterium]|nr:glycosyltransferase family 2 protein [Tissierellales bacterium]